ncbi:MAG TPA: universal stress protein [Polyangiaceae bacterium]|nr:universal stress protein [Polyangiaceae bacterium]
MKTFKHILVTTDFEPSSAEALDVAMSLAQAFDAKLTLLHVWELPIYPYMEFMLNSEVITSIEDRAVKRLDEAITKVRAVLPSANSMLKTGTPWGGIIDAINELEPDLVVMGTHGRRGFSHLMLGSVAEKVVQLSPTPVLTVRPKQSS